MIFHVLLKFLVTGDMIFKEIYTNIIPILKPSDDCVKALHWMDEYKVNHLPVVENAKYLGIISEADILEVKSTNMPVGKIKNSLSRPFVFDYNHVFDGLKMYAMIKLSIIPVLDSKENYIGCVTQRDLLSCLATLTGALEPGCLIILELNGNDYALSQIAQIVESNDAKILSLFLKQNKENSLLEITIKINLIDPSAVLQTFDRYGYKVKASYFHTSATDKNYKERYDALMHYLNI